MARGKMGEHTHRLAARGGHSDARHALEAACELDAACITDDHCLHPVQGPLDPTSQAPRATPNPLEHPNITDIRYDEDYLRFYQ